MFQEIKVTNMEGRIRQLKWQLIIEYLMRREDGRNRKEGNNLINDELSK